MKSLPRMERSVCVIPLWLLQISWSPFLFQNGRIMPRLQSSGSLSYIHTWLMMCWSQRDMLSPPTLSISAVMLQIPGALEFFSFLSAALTSARDTGVMSHSGLGAVAELASYVRVGSSGTGGWLSSWQKCSFHRWMQSSSVVSISLVLSLTRKLLCLGPAFARRRRL